MAAGKRAKHSGEGVFMGIGVTDFCTRRYLEELADRGCYGVSVEGVAEGFIYEVLQRLHREGIIK